ncbi:MAG TPA: MBL fold metallo-hydrolase [Planctomycetota bacterium]|nr:MBL fold metallo-hydrolase [Planctomycetota bacterium]
MVLELKFLGAARHVTGTKHLLTVGDRRVLLDCGLVQGPRRVADEQNRKLPIAGGEVDAVVLSHAHIDHCGALPRLVKDGFDGPIWCTDATADMVRMMLLDSAHIQSQDAMHLRKRGHEVEPLYDTDDVERTLRLVRHVPYHQEFEVTPQLRVQFLDAGHILGAAIVVMDVDCDHKQRRIVFTGDFGRKNLPILRDPERIPECDVLITESTYGDRIHEQRSDMMAELARIIAEEMHDGGRVIVPAFAVGRTQSVVLFLGQLMRDGHLAKLPIYVDSPMSRDATKIMSQHPDLFDQESSALLKAGHHPLFFEGVRYVADVAESKSLNQLRTGVVIAASGMCEAGRVLHHLAHSVGRREDCVLLVGYQAHGTLGRRLLDGEKRVNILGESYEVKCKIRSMLGLSAHADWRELMAASRHLAGRCKQAFVVHGEDEPAEAYAGRLRNAGFRSVVVPSKYERAEIQ